MKNKTCKVSIFRPDETNSIFNLLTSVYDINRINTYRINIKLANA